MLKLPHKKFFLIAGLTWVVLGLIPRHEKRLFGLTQSQRKQVWLNYLAAGEKAAREAENTYPVLDPRLAHYSEIKAKQQNENRQALRETLGQTYTHHLLESHGLTPKQYGEIEQEGYRKHWHKAWYIRSAQPLS